MTTKKGQLYTVQVKQVSASEARKNWFRLLDDVVGGEVVVIQRRGKRLVLHCEELDEDMLGAEVPDYKDLLRVADAERADQWRWDWVGSDEGLVPIPEHEQ
ncbi:hypothetical protein MYX65_12515 [Acidobacteria bacterium AH-259-L09]|nr:hypothetical protein [Acidobacteria bacterium AH-259-L09]